MSPSEEQDLEKNDEVTGSGNRAEFTVQSDVRGTFHLTDDEIMDILNYAKRINR